MRDIVEKRDDMFIPRREFYLRAFSRLTPHKKVNCMVSVDELYEEAIKDAPYRSHEFLIDKTLEEIYKMEAQEQDGLKDYNYSTEGQRFEHIKDELIKDTYEKIVLYKDIDHPTIKHLSNGFHRIFMAKHLGMKELRCEVWYGKFELKNSLSFEDFTAYVREFKEIYLGMYRKTIEEGHQEELKEFPNLETFNGFFQFCELMCEKDKKDNTITILSTREKEKNNICDK